MKTLLALLCLASPALAAMKVATLHPIVADLARQVGGANVEVVEILKPGGDVHHFEPATKDIAAMRGSKLILASGKGLETYLDKLRDSLGAGVKLVEVGEKVPSIPYVCDHDHSEEHDHHHGEFDPHWWHSAENMQRAARIVAQSIPQKKPRLYRNRRTEHSEMDPSPVSAVSVEEASKVTWSLDAFCISEELAKEAAAIIEWEIPSARAAVQKLDDKDWVAVSLAGLPAVHAGPFVVAGWHELAHLEGGKIPVWIEAGPAFGTAVACLILQIPLQYLPIFQR